MKLLNLLFLSTGLIFESCSQDCDKYKVQYQPNTKYISSMTSTSKTIVNYEGTEELIAHLISKGYSKTSVVEGGSKLKTITSTDKTNSSNNFKLMFEITESKGGNIKNGKWVEKENPELLKVKLFGHCSLEGATKIDSVTGENVDESLKKIFIQSFGSLNDIVSFSDKCLKVGDAFDKESIIETPMEGFNPLKINVVTKYTLTKKEKKLAFFNIEQVYKLSNSSEKMELELNVNGTGEGNIIVDSENNFLTYYESKTNLNYDMKAGELIMKMQQIATTIQKTQITKK